MNSYCDVNQMYLLKTACDKLIAQEIEAVANSCCHIVCLSLKVLLFLGDHSGTALYEQRENVTMTVNR